MHPFKRSLLVTLLVAGLVQVAPGVPHAQEIDPDHVVRSAPENVVWGWYPLDRAPVLTVGSGDTVRIDTLSHAGTTQPEEPVEYL
ncbi:MAG: hypothetical protein OXG72_08275, partial [Acidobacteria bacterium]|nr:hypothetical protein [Acidobacteriota bacterium]